MYPWSISHTWFFFSRAPFVKNRYFDVFNGSYPKTKSLPCVYRMHLNRMINALLFRVTKLYVAIYSQEATSRSWSHGENRDRRSITAVNAKVQLPRTRRRDVYKVACTLYMGKTQSERPSVGSRENNGSWADWSLAVTAYFILVSVTRSSTSRTYLRTYVYPVNEPTERAPRRSVVEAGGSKFRAELAMTH